MRTDIAEAVARADAQRGEMTWHDLNVVRELYPALDYIFDHVEDLQDKVKEQDEHLAKTCSDIEEHYEERLGSINEEIDEAMGIIGSEPPDEMRDVYAALSRAKTYLEN
jgi:hypothetical protein